METGFSKRDSVKRAAALLKCPASADRFVILKLLPEPSGCCCFHCWPSTWAEINRYISPQGPVPDEGDALLRTKGGEYVLECHESGPEIVVSLVKASLAVAKPVVDLLTRFLKALQKERHKSLSSVKLSHCRITNARVKDEILMEISFPLSDETVKAFNGKIQEVLQQGTKGHLSGDPGNSSAGS